LLLEQNTSGENLDKVYLRNDQFSRAGPCEEEQRLRDELYVVE
jgi:hypothetical protein